MSGSAKALIFDMDGTMIDNMMVHHHAWQKMLSDEGIQMSLEEVQSKVHGVNIEILERLFGDRFSAMDRERMSLQKENLYRQTFKDQLQLIDGLDFFLEEAFARAIPMAIASAAPPENVDFVLDNLQIRHYFSSILHAQDVRFGKPNPEVFIRSAEAMQVPISDCIVFEDSLVGAEASSRAGASMVLVTTTHPVSDFIHFDHILSDIPNFLNISVQDILTTT